MSAHSMFISGSVQPQPQFVKIVMSISDLPSSIRERIRDFPEWRLQANTYSFESPDNDDFEFRDPYALVGAPIRSRPSSRGGGIALEEPTE